MMSILSVLTAPTVPAANSSRTLTLRSGKPVRMHIATRKLPGSPNYLYAVTCKDVVILELISNPGDDDIRAAYARAVAAKKFEHCQGAA